MTAAPHRHVPPVALDEVLQHFYPARVLRVLLVAPPIGAVQLLPAALLVATPVLTLAASAGIEAEAARLLISKARLPGAPQCTCARGDGASPLQRGRRAFGASMAVIGLTIGLTIGQAIGLAVGRGVAWLRGRRLRPSALWLDFEAVDVRAEEELGEAQRRLGGEVDEGAHEGLGVG